MTDLTIYHLLPPPGSAALMFHFGRQGIGLEEAGETLASDSLFAALVAQAATLDSRRGAAGEPTWATPFVGSEPPPLILSSLFPRLCELVLLPRPALPIPNMDKELRAEIGKGFKKLRYLSPALFAAVCSGRAIREKPLLLQNGKIWISHAEAAQLPAGWTKAPAESDEAWRNRLAATPIWEIEALPRVTVDRVSNASAYYEVGRVTYAPEAGLALLVRFTDATAQAHFEHLLTLLGESGLGGRRSSGYGAFRWQHGGTLQLDLAAGKQRAILLSRYVPREDELDGLRSERASYQLVNVAGWLYSTGSPAQRRQQIRMVAEGSVLDTTQGMPRGAVLDVRPDYSQSSRPHPILGAAKGTSHPVYRSGLALALAIPDPAEVNV